MGGQSVDLMRVALPDYEQFKLLIKRSSMSYGWNEQFGLFWSIVGDVGGL